MIYTFLSSVFLTFFFLFAAWSFFGFAELWRNKIKNNRARDQKNYNTLINAGWQVIVLWQCELTKDKLETTMQQTAVALNHNLLKIIK